MLAAALLGLLVGGRPAVASRTVVKDRQGLAFGYYTDVGLFGGPSTRLGYGQTTGSGLAPASDDTASPSVICPKGSRTATAVDPDSTWDDDTDPGDGSWAVYGPAVVFGGISRPDAPDIPSGPLTASIDCHRGPGGHVTASAAVTLMPPGSIYDPLQGGAQPHPGGVGPGVFVADEVHSTCTMTTEGVTGAATIVNGRVATHAQAWDHDTGVVPVPENPAPNTVVEGHLHLNLEHQETYRIVFNEQTTNPDGSLTVDAVHMYLQGPIAVGDMVVGSSTCGPLDTVT